RITWTSCSIFPVEKYEIYRYEQSDAFPVFVGESSVNMFEDRHSGEPSSADKLFYFVTAIERNNEQNTEVRTSNSSHNYIKHQTLFFIPNAFDPTEGMITKIQNFKPEVSYIKKESYDFKIYNRWGGLVFSTNNTEEGWNGTYKGELCDKGIYVYKIQFKNSDGKMEKHSGTFMLYD
ncbi:MAG: gliding motility-associated C-terminal domain-containing protein, partial [Bacteroidales bacterium]|nr:gliding motility-associated C-terminal domain-containing protein [Bacteroidales bacterium]